VAVIFIYSDARIRNADLQFRAIKILGIAHHCHLHTPLKREFERIGNQIYENLFDSLNIKS
jgi:hypothetical protein